MGAPYQWTSDITERCHITHVKTPYRLSNRRNFHEQCSRYMDHIEKWLLFKLYTTVKELSPSLINEMEFEAEHVAENYPEAAWLSGLAAPPEGNIGEAPSIPSSLFSKNRSRSLFSRNRSMTTVDQTTAFTVAQKPHYIAVPIIHVTNGFKLLDFRAALGDFFALRQSYSTRRGMRKSSPNCSLDFETVHVWESFRMQQRSAQDPQITLPVQTIQALPCCCHAQMSCHLAAGILFWLMMVMMGIQVHSFLFFQSQFQVLICSFCADILGATMSPA